MDIWELIRELRKRYGDRAWQPVIEAEIMADEIAKRVVSELMRRIPKPERFKPVIQPPFEKVISKTHDFIRVEGVSGSLIEFSFSASNSDFRLYVERDGDMLISGQSFNKLMDISPSVAWLTAIQRVETNEYWLQISGIDFSSKLVIGVEPDREVKLYNVSWSYIIFER